MHDYKNVIRNIENSESGPHIGAIFDFDGTIIAGYSATALLKEQLRRGDISLEHSVDILRTTAQIAVGKIGFSGMMAASAKLLTGTEEQDYEELGEKIYTGQIRAKIYPEARAIIEAHRARGHTLAIISSATPYQVEPAARELGIEHVLCTRFEVENGRFTGDVIRPVCFGEGKVIAAEHLAQTHGIALGESYFYSDSDDDIELLEKVGRPQAMNPNKKLTKVAESRGWQIRRLRENKSPGLLARARSIAATGSLVTSFASGLPILGLTGSKREAVNFSTSMFGDISTALIGMKLNITNEKYLWSARPCVFVFNHQSGADLMIIAKLLKRDIAGIGKKELAKVPLIGAVIQYAGAVLIDRENTKNAIEAMRPLVDKINNEKISVCIAPEGTRSNERALGKFKKGAFHLAMQAGVPIIPIVIHNSCDALPADSKVFYPATIDVDVLEPVDTSNWTTGNLDQQVADLERQYLQALGYDNDPRLLASAPAKNRAATAKPKNVRVKNSKGKAGTSGGKPASSASTKTDRSGSKRGGKLSAVTKRVAEDSAI